MGQGNIEDTLMSQLRVQSPSKGLKACFHMMTYFIEVYYLNRNVFLNMPKNDI